MTVRMKLAPFSRRLTSVLWTSVAVAMATLVIDARFDAAAATPRPSIQAVYAQLPLSFELNQGQSAAEVKFLARGAGYAIALAPGETILSLRQAAASPNAASPERRVVRMRYAGTPATGTLSGLQTTTGRVNYYLGTDRTHWRENVPTYGKVLHQNVYPGVDLVFYGRQGQLEYDFVVQPGAKSSQIALAFEGADRLELDRHGALLVHVADGVLKNGEAPVVPRRSSGSALCLRRVRADQ